jgi:hypothetical protein
MKGNKSDCEKRALPPTVGLGSAPYVGEGGKENGWRQRHGTRG